MMLQVHSPWLEKFQCHICHFVPLLLGTFNTLSSNRALFFGMLRSLHIALQINKSVRNFCVVNLVWKMWEKIIGKLYCTIKNRHLVLSCSKKNWNKKEDNGTYKPMVCVLYVLWLAEGYTFLGLTICCKIVTVVKPGFWVKTKLQPIMLKIVLSKSRLCLRTDCFIRVH